MSSPNRDELVRIGEKFRTLRSYHQLTLSHLSVMLGYQTHSYLAEIEAGRKVPTVHTVLRTARLFGITTDSLLFDELEIDVDQSVLSSDNAK